MVRLYVYFNFNFELTFSALSKSISLWVYKKQKSIFIKDGQRNVGSMERMVRFNFHWFFTTCKK